MSHKHSRSSASALDGLIALVALVGSALQIPGRIRQAQRKIDTQAARVALDRARLTELHHKTETAEQESHLRSNKVVLADLEIEIKKLQLLKLQQELGLTVPDFTPPDYSSDPTPEA
jgi:hypothetical protein